MAIADKSHGKRIDKKIQRSRDAIRAFVGCGMFYCGVSWGKDSVVVAHLAHGMGFPLVNLRCTNRNPECDAVRDEFLSRFPSAYHEVDVDYSCVDRTATDGEIDRQTDVEWRNGIAKCCGIAGTVRRLLGLRAGESATRFMRMARNGENSLNSCCPIAWWTVADVFGYLARFDLPIHPAYAMSGGGRWSRDHLRVAELGDTHGRRMGRLEWEREYYGDELRRLGI